MRSCWHYLASGTRPLLVKAYVALTLPRPYVTIPLWLTVMPLSGTPDCPRGVALYLARSEFPPSSGASGRPSFNILTIALVLLANVTRIPELALMAVSMLPDVTVVSGADYPSCRGSSVLNCSIVGRKHRVVEPALRA